MEREGWEGQGGGGVAWVRGRTWRPARHPPVSRRRLAPHRVRAPPPSPAAESTVNRNRNDRPCHVPMNEVRVSEARPCMRGRTATASLTCRWSSEGRHTCVTLLCLASPPSFSAMSRLTSTLCKAHSSNDAPPPQAARRRRVRRTARAARSRCRCSATTDEGVSPSPRARQDHARACASRMSRSV